jgi:malonyl-CoA/methylmalonyl-CoA synthetase
MASTLPRLPIFEAIAKHDPTSTAIVHSKSGRSFTYGQLLSDVAATKARLVEENGEGGKMEGQRIAFLVENSYDYVGAQDSFSQIYTEWAKLMRG